jgi:hypothetical protein
MTDKKLNPARLEAYQKSTFRLTGGQRLRNVDQAVAYVNQRGFIYFWPIKDINLPSLWAATAGDRPVADAHDDPGHVTWGWKDGLLGKRRWYYAKVLRKKATIISLETLPYFYALSENYGSPEDDYLTLYEQGRLTQEARAVYEAILKDGPLDTIALRKATRLTSSESDSRFNRALSDLQADFKILPVGVSQAGRWRYAFIYDLAPRHFPDLIDRTRHIGDRQARQRLADLYFRSVGAAQPRCLRLLFGWSPPDIDRLLDDLVSTAGLVRGLEHPARPGEWLALPELVDGRNPIA